MNTVRQQRKRYPGSSALNFDFPSNRGVHPGSAAQWDFALSGTWTGQANVVAGNIDFYAYTPVEVASSASRILNERPDAYVAVGADWVDVIRGLLSPRVPADHVVAW